MLLRRKEALKPFLIILLALLATLINGCSTFKQESRRPVGHLEQNEPAQTLSRKVDDEQIKQVFDHVVENLRYCRYWFGTPDIGDDYVDGKKVSALIFWTKAGHQSKAGFCSPDLSRCLATSATHLRPEMDQMLIDRGLSAQAAFESFVKNGIDADVLRIVPQMQPSSPNASPAERPMTSVPTIPSDLTGQSFPSRMRLNLTDFEFAEKTVTLPPLSLPIAVLRREVPKEAANEAKRIRQYYTCWYENSVKSPGCTGSLVFAYYQEADPNWFVLRTCSSACSPGFQGDSIQILRRWDDDKWEASGGGGINSPKEEVARFKQKIEQAEMFRLQIP